MTSGTINVELAGFISMLLSTKDELYHESPKNSDLIVYFPTSRLKIISDWPYISVVPTILLDIPLEFVTVNVIGILTNFLPSSPYKMA